jgi:hypothetical protein
MLRIPVLSHKFLDDIPIFILKFSIYYDVQYLETKGTRSLKSKRYLVLPAVSLEMLIAFTRIRVT